MLLQISDLKPNKWYHINCKSNDAKQAYSGRALLVTISPTGYPEDTLFCICETGEEGYFDVSDF